MKKSFFALIVQNGDFHRLEDDFRDPLIYLDVAVTRCARFLVAVKFPRSEEGRAWLVKRGAWRVLSRCGRQPHATRHGPRATEAPPTIWRTKKPREAFPGLMGAVEESFDAVGAGTS